MTYWKGGETYHILQAMKATGNEPGVIERWKNGLAEWASTRNPNDADIAAIHAWLPLWQVRPFYTANELAPLWPALSIVTGFTDRWPAVLKSARRLENELDFHLAPRLSEPYREYFICERIHYWKNASLKEIENALG